MQIFLTPSCNAHPERQVAPPAWLLPRKPHWASQQQTTGALNCVCEHLCFILIYMVHLLARCVLKFQWAYFLKLNFCYITDSKLCKQHYRYPFWPPRSLWRISPKVHSKHFQRLWIRNVIQSRNDGTDGPSHLPDNDWRRSPGWKAAIENGFEVSKESLICTHNTSEEVGIPG
ncbi:unnamed protein product [Nyctereutes procyonoides]|uniref:(raccoon dog) hypothetical protein n=1 Tax=Nyctereutes procyonoides TaxID=34880 RepID=A0A811YSD3_NYCPR|nr:unnamed protein product [Nyctereutes procyonoides]CAD7688205.1 unnamed protein product [Nyctereutes procyonoides]